MTRKAIIRLGVIGDGDKTVVLSRNGLLTIIEAVLSECECIETEIKTSMCIDEKDRLMCDYHPLVAAYHSLNDMADAIKD